MNPQPMIDYFWTAVAVDAVDFGDPAHRRQSRRVSRAQNVLRRRYELWLWPWARNDTKPPYQRTPGRFSYLRPEGRQNPSGA